MLNLAFEIGFDHYRYSQPLDITRFYCEESREQVRSGFEAATLQGVSKKKPDKYEKKLLSIRGRAFNKGLLVTITTEDLKKELNKTGGKCPITGKELTFAENDSTDWSIDRVDNGRGYCPDNIVVVSVVANQAKSNLDLSGLIKAALAEHDNNELLSENEWFKLARFYFKRMKFIKPLHFCQLLTNSQSLFDQLVFLQFFHTKQKKSKDFLKKLEKYVRKTDIQKAEKLVHKRVCQKANIDVSVIYNSPKLYKSVREFVSVINKNSNDFDGLLMNCLFS